MGLKVEQLHLQMRDISGSKWQEVRAEELDIDHVHLFGTEFHNVVLPIEGDGNYNPQGQYKPITFQNCNLTNTQLKNCNLSNVEISDCDITGLKINGILISDLLKDK